jgi:hypothetical protein
MGFFEECQMNEIDLTGLKERDDVEMRKVVTAWLRAFEEALSSGHHKKTVTLFETEGNWRDVLAFTWHLTSKVGVDAVAEAGSQP